LSGFATTVFSGRLRADEFEGTVNGAGDYSSVADLHDRAVEQTGVGDDRRDDLVVRRVFGQAEFLELRLFFAKEIKSRNAELL
jgi:hypothetical protein